MARVLDTSIVACIYKLQAKRVPEYSKRGSAETTSLNNQKPSSVSEQCILAKVAAIREMPSFGCAADDYLTLAKGVFGQRAESGSSVVIVVTICLRLQGE